MLFLAYELGYWFNHWLSHRVPLLWEFHKVHHSAEVLTPLTNFRVHPVYTWVFANILALSAAIANGFANYMFGETTYQYAFADSNIILVLFIHAYVHLQHSHVWIAFSGWLGRVFVSPAHHQIHHSTNPKHFNRNYGSCLALWDWMFGTLYVPGKEKEKLSFGAEKDEYPAHTISGELIAPFIRAGARRAPECCRGLLLLCGAHAQLELLAEVRAAAVLLEQVGEGLLGDLLDALHLIARHHLDRIPGLAIEAQPLADQFVAAHHFQLWL